MARVYFIGDEATAAGYRLAGAEVRVPSAADVADVLRRARESEADLILLSAQLLGALPASDLEAALLGDRPFTAIVPDVHGRHPTPDVAREVRLALGIEP